MHPRLSLLALAAVLVLPASRSHAQPDSSRRTLRDVPVDVFLDCGFDCDQDFVRTEVTYVNWVRDRQAADVHVLVTSQGTGGGGREFTLAFLGARAFAGTGDTLVFNTAQGATGDEIRRAMTRTLGQGLVPFVARTTLGARLVVSLAPAPASAGQPAASVQSRRDPWNLWVYTIGANVNTSGEAQSSYTSLNGNASARRTTEAWKLNVSARQNYNVSTFDLGDGETSKFIRRSTNVSQLAVRSLGPRLSAGLRSAFGASTFENKSFFGRITPAVEYDVWPYSESTRRMLTLQYAIGAETFRYMEETIFFRTKETRPIHSLNASLTQNQPWGSVNLGLDASQYLDQTNKNSASIYGGTSVRLFKGFNFNISGSFSSIHNQLYLARSGATDEEILTQQRRLATNYSFFAFAGISYTFGSVVNNVVNPRFGRDGGGGSCFCF